MIEEKNNLLTIQITKDKLLDYIPDNIKIKKWATVAFETKRDSLVIIKIAHKDEIMKLNKFFFKKNKPTNVLSFPNNSIVKTGEFILGDIIICPEIINNESKTYNIDRQNRWAHMIIHSMLHLQGYTHDLDKHQVIMENREKKLMNLLGYSDPYYAN
ncbi:MAG: rRNA maturation RNase YbeY [Gammaproteobacteria bacterium]|jgi:probable rRNA maturation factor|nr:rRNA maturation RNase YbeY [Gammaproteobacteria bacterium]MBT4462848.1 rRNA maturation RNase YbeY [Gammaproteobacteria bacterium]MBT4655117.1 rRNA maturation RNase YbeY [Gammaproteobacteria bacterium]MBT5116703.1 rRNA maturation RNase YbeY [Gammaproteobacteria bacterium]MBT5761801.1 rRNA maturation RNase YbeY [Gammaproteobacteria bacterium]|tara:strand:+ start:477 stop:947 length:471 start_codon:yes stop_codon:yes gene_type:complete